MSPPNRESVAEIARDTGITAQTIYNWRSQWQKQGQLVPSDLFRQGQQQTCTVLRWEPKPGSHP